MGGARDGFRSRALVGLVVAGAVLGAPVGGRAWLFEGHRRVAVAAVEALPAEVPEAFRSRAATIGELAEDPDAWRLEATPHLRDRESPEHYLDLERLGGAPLPRYRSELVRRIGSLELGVAEVGFLPWAVIEETERLTLAFAQLRRWPANEAARVQAVVVAGRLAHYGADLVQPLHTTIHHDGWALPDGSSPHQGIHRRIDALLGGLEPERARAVPGSLEAPVFDDPATEVRAQLAASHALVDRVYEIDRRLTGADGVDDPAVAAFRCERYRTAVLFVAGLMRTAWEESAELELPEWLER